MAKNTNNVADELRKHIERINRVNDDQLADFRKEIEEDIFAALSSCDSNFHRVARQKIIKRVMAQLDRGDKLQDIANYLRGNISSKVRWISHSTSQTSNLMQSCVASAELELAELIEEFLA